MFSICLVVPQLVLVEVDVPYILYVLEAEEFADMVGENTLHTLISSTQARYPGFTICFLVNKLKWYLHKKYFLIPECGTL